jgi:triosephosphate isomerase (TIM)
MTPLVVGNWKMHGTLASRAEIGAIARGLDKPGLPPVEAVVCLPFTLLFPAQKIAAGTKLKVGAQDCHFEKEGAFTGDVSAPMLKEAGCAYVIVGHSERRAGHGETSELVRRKAEAVLAAGMTPIVCVGETKAERAAGKAKATVEAALKASLPKASGAVIAYEPVWAIGTGENAKPADIAGMHGFIRLLLGPAGKTMRIVYGGSVTPENVKEIFAAAEVNGALVGGASLKAQSFLAIVKSLPKTP